VQISKAGKRFHRFVTTECIHPYPS